MTVNDTQTGDETMADTKNKVHHLVFLAHEDEAQMTGTSFEAHGTEVRVWSTFRGYDEWEVQTERMMPLAEARKLWKELLETGEYEFSHSY